MSGGAFRDAGSAAFERVAILEQENADLEAELKKLRAELDSLRAQDGRRDESPREISRLQVQLAAERADLKEALSELNPLAVKLERAEKAYHEAQDDRRLALREANIARGQLTTANEGLATAQQERADLLDEVRALKEAAAKAPRSSLLGALFRWR
jgi:chromosome segregation ATPase